MAFDGVVPVANIHRSARAVSAIDRDKAQIGREKDVALILLLEIVVLFDPLVDLHPIGRLVTHFDEAALQFFGPGSEIHKLLAAHAGIGRDA